MSVQIYNQTKQNIFNKGVQWLKLFYICGMNYRETLDWLYSCLPVYQRIGGAAYKSDLQTTIDLLDALGNPQHRFKAVHIAGTNGKGSVSHITASVLQEAGYKTGLYTSPHLKDFRERIKLNGVPLPEDYVVAFVKKNGGIFRQLKPSFFEMTVAMAFDYFAARGVDVAVLETGMGGRLDSTNLCQPVVTAITNIGYDHTKFLGETLREIATEKAGIIKKNVPLVVGRRQAETETVFENAAQLNNAPLIFAEDNIELKRVTGSNSNDIFYDIWVGNLLYAGAVNFPLAGNYQKENIATAMQIIFTLNDMKLFRLDKKDIVEGIEQTVNNTGLEGRWQILSKNPLTIADTAHNIDGIKAVTQQLRETDYDKLHFVLGMVNDKNHEEILSLLPKGAQYYFCSPDIPRALDAETLSLKAIEAGLNGYVYPSVRHAYNSAVNNAGIRDLVFVGGSTFVVSEVI
jgi:dihydrofolate synthase/folylpolyglutamate synthase